MQTVLYLDGSALLLSEIRRSGRITHAYVVNGGWWLVLKGNKAQARDGNGGVVTRWAFQTYEEVQTNARGDYNAVIASADLRRVDALRGS